MIYRQYGEVLLKVFDTREEMGLVAAQEAMQTIADLLTRQEYINCIFAAAPSQTEFLGALSRQDITWKRINAFHMDEYLGLPIGSPSSFGAFLNYHIFGKVSFRALHLIDGNAKSEEECARYAKLLNKFPPDIVFMGIGENGHIAFNDPAVANFEDPLLVKEVVLEKACRIQQVHDGCFPSLKDVPEKAITLTTPALLSARHVFCIVPGERKAAATAAALMGEITTACPAGILRKKTGTRMYIDTHCAVGLQ